MVRAAFRTYFHTRLFVSAVMTSHLSVPMDRKRHIAMRTLYNMPAFPARNKPGIPSPVQKKHRLFFLFKPLFHQSLQLFAEYRTISVLQFFPHIHRINLCRILHFRTVLHFHQNILAVFCPIHGFHRRSRASQNNARAFCLRSS